LFTDLVGSTALASRVGPDRAEQLRVEHFTLLRGAVERHGGVEVKNLGDGLMVVFESASSALACAVAMQQAFDVRNRFGDGTARLEIRVGVAAGEADVDDDDYFGPPVVEAARLCSVADGGQILATQVARLIAGSRGDHVFTALGARELKGLPAPVEVVEVGWEALTEADHAGFSVPFPSRLVPATGSVFVGRSRELARADQAWKAVYATDRRIWLVAGEAGIGKTTLVSRIASDIHGSGGVVVYGRCDEDLGVPYQPWVEALTTLVQRLPDDALEAHVAERRGDLARVVPALTHRTGAAPPAADDPEAERYALIGAVADLLARASALAPVLLVLDDLHWADAPTISMLRHLATQSDPLRVFVVATYRQTDLTASHPLTQAMAQLHRESSVEFVDLAGLDDAELLQLMEAIAGHEMEDDGVAVRDMIAAETGGNAFFATEVLRHLASTGAIEYREGRWVPTVDLTEQGLPVSVREVVSRRVARLGVDAERLLRFASVIGRDFDLDLVAEVAEIDEDEALDLLEAAEASAVVANIAPDRYMFSHALVATVLYDEMSPARRSRVHRRVAEALERQLGARSDERVGELARHWAAATVPDDAGKAIEYARRAGERAIAQLAPDEALRWFHQGLDLCTPDTDEEVHTRLLIGLGTAQRQIGDPAHRDTLLEASRRADAIGATDLLVSAALANHRGIPSIAGGTDAERVALLEKALDAVGTTDSTDRARLLAVLATELTFDPDRERCHDLSAEAVGIARRVGDAPTLLAVLRGVLADSDWYSTPAREEIVAVSDEVIDLAVSLGDYTGLAHGAASVASTMLALGDRHRYDRAVQLCVESATRVGQPLLLFRAAAVEATAAIIDGRLDEAETRAADLLDLGTRTGQPDVLVWYASLLATLRQHQGRAGELRDLAQGFADTSEPGTMIEQVARLGMVLGALDDADLARARADLATVDAFGNGLFIFKIFGLCVASEAAVRLGDTVLAAALFDALAPFHGMIECSVVTSSHSTSTCLGMLAELLGLRDEADTYFEEAAGLTEEFGAPYHLAVTSTEWARVLLGRDRVDVDHVTELLDAAGSAAERHGFGAVARDVAALRSQVERAHR
jgi:class 3 adenylate cyclase